MSVAAEMPLRFASREPLAREDLSAVPLRSVPRPSLLAEPLDVQHKKTAAALETLGLETPHDLLEHLPFRHEDRRDARPIASLAPGEHATVIGDVRRIARLRGRRGRPRVEATVADETGVVKAVWFNQPWLADQIAAGSRLVLHGKRKDRNQLWVTSHELAAGVTPDDVRAEGMTPVYPATEGVTSDRLRELVKRLRGLEIHTVDWLPGLMRAAEGLPDRAAALRAVHFPEDEGETEAARRRLAFEELLALKLALLSRKRARREAHTAPVLEANGELVGPWLASLPFELTEDQRRAIEAIDGDLRSGRPMQRLLMGEVGSGKTVVALHAMLRAAENGRQGALMAPTETLAEQHLATLDRLLGGHLPIALLTGSTPAARRREIMARLESGELRMVVGTHALIEDAVEFRDLAVAVVDEQHRFGVRQRAALEAKGPAGAAPHVLHLTATPIPRTLQLTLYGDLDATALRGLPAGRKPVETFVVSGARARARAYERAREEIRAGRQVFVVCPLVEESEALQSAAATAEAERLARTEFRDHRVELIHGQMPSKRKAEAMRAFAAGQADVLVATSVIEVGIDVPNAAVMLIEAAERYGISQLHQLRGRIGRGEHPGLCVLLGDPGQPRLRALAEERDGFRLAEIDLALRKGGEVLGTRQHGYQEFRVARLPEDADLLERAQTVAARTLAADPDLEAPENALLRDEVVTRFGSAREAIPA
ncbi:MAG TPA: ATP-dependent DNA helicase RecG [Thermoleophilaceae bacterium]|nr:ATP-dependent DNA helicase RecG [Thermoleophilaceae bacterium]